MRFNIFRGAVHGIVLLWSISGGSLAAQQRSLTLDTIYDPDTRTNFSGNPPPQVAWTDGTHYTWPRGRQGDGFEWVKADAVSGMQAPLFDAGKMAGALSQISGVSSDSAWRVAHGRQLTINATYTAAVVTLGDDLYAYSFDNGRVVRLSTEPGAEQDATFSPDGKWVAFVRGNNLHVSEVATGDERALTGDGGPKVLNGRLDWVYEEEIYGRGQRRAFWWSPDSASIAFLRLDDTPVPTYTVVDHIPYEQTIEPWDYPKAGDPNPLVKIGVVQVRTGSLTWIDTSKYPPADHLVVRVGWTPDSRQVVYEAQNRTQTWIDLNLGDAASGATRTILRDANTFWISAEDTVLPLWLKDGTFLWLSDRSGWRHLNHYAANGALIKAVTSGKWELRELHGVDRPNDWIYFSGTARSLIGSDVYRIRLDGGGLQRLSTAEGTHAATFSPSFSFYTDAWSNVTTPTQTRLHKSDGTEVRVIDGNAVPVLAEYALAKPEFLQVKTRDGFVMEAMMIKPQNFEPSRRYPVYQFIYGGPHSPQVRNAWGGTQYLYHQLLAQHGIIVWICDNRTASGKGSESAWPLYKHMGESELRDIEDGVSWLKQQAYVDGSRIGLHGWSYGGFMTSFALTHSTTFSMGIAGGTVGDWRNYDTVYTERYMGLPSDNPDGYRASAPRFAAANLHGNLLLLHGMIDDNVHLANTIQFAYELEKAQKPFQLMLYPKSRHGVVDPVLVKHLRATMFDFVLDHLKPATTAGAAGAASAIQ